MTTYVFFNTEEDPYLSGARTHPSTGRNTLNPLIHYVGEASFFPAAPLRDEPLHNTASLILIRIIRAEFVGIMKIYISHGD